MRKFFSFIKNQKKNIRNFHGGIHFSTMKIQSNNIELHRLFLPKRLIVPIKQHFGIQGELCVKKGDHVLRGQELTTGYPPMVPVHSPTSGKIVSIALHQIAHPLPRSELCVTIDADGEDLWIKLQKWSNYRLYSRKDIINRIHQYGIVGLGGAGFPTSKKLENYKKNIETLIINAAECEPYVTSDDCLIQNHASQIVEGIRILSYILRPKITLIGIEDDKLQAISILESALIGNNDIILRIIPKKYPSGSTKQLTFVLTGKEIPHNKNSTEIGVIVQNVSTVYAIKRAVIDGEPLTERVITITGKTISKPRNVWVRIGTSVYDLLNKLKLISEKEQTIIIGGPMTGFKLSCIEAPIVKTTNCIFLPCHNEVISHVQQERNCIRCGACADVCPMNLLPQQLYWFSKNRNHEKTVIYNILDCIECEACTLVCPSNIPLVKYFRQEKFEHFALSAEKKRAETAKMRFQAKKTRLEKEKFYYRKKSVFYTSTKDLIRSYVKSAINRKNINKKNFSN